MKQIVNIQLELDTKLTTSQTIHCVKDYIVRTIKYEGNIIPLVQDHDIDDLRDIIVEKISII